MLAFISTFANLLFLLVGFHFLADYPLQGDFLAQAKNRNTSLGVVFWKHALFAHSFIHGLFVYLITGSLLLGVTEIIIHAITDFLKCEKRISLNTDQAIHIGCKVIYVLMIAKVL